MEIVNVAAAALGAFAFGAVWYMSMSKAWIAAAGIAVDANGKPQGNGSMAPFAVGLVAMVVVAGMMRHILASAGIVSAGGGSGCWRVPDHALGGDELRLRNAQAGADADRRGEFGGGMRHHRTDPESVLTGNEMGGPSPLKDPPATHVLP